LGALADAIGAEEPVEGGRLGTDAAVRTMIASDEVPAGPAAVSSLARSQRQAGSIATRQ